jgi:hypothetical protein
LKIFDEDQKISFDSQRGLRACLAYGHYSLMLTKTVNFTVRFRDNVPAICLGQWPLNADLFDGDEQAGPVPTLFAEDVEAAAEGLNRNAARAHADIQKLSRVFFMPEVVDLEEATSIIKKPR